MRVPKLPKMRPGVRALPIVRTPAPHGAAERVLGVVDPAGGCMAFVVSKRGDAGPPRGPPRPQELNQSLGKLPKAVLRLLYGCALADLAPRLGHAKDQVKEPKSGVPNSRLALPFIGISERCYS